MTPRSTTLAFVPLSLLLVAPAAAVERSGPQSGTWLAADNPHVVRDEVTVPAGEVLTLEAGTVVEFARGARMFVDGLLRSAGTEAMPVVLAAGGPGPLPGDWEGLALGSTGRAALQATWIRDAVVGVDAEPGAFVQATGSWFTGCQGDAVVLRGGGGFVSCTFARNGKAGLQLVDGSPVVLGCTFVGNDRAVALAGESYPRFHACVARDHASFDGAVVDAARPPTGGGSWWGGGLPYVLHDGTNLLVATDRTLRLEPGTIVKLGSAAQVTVRGRLESAGTPDQPCLLTALTDDDALGDTNRDGGTTWPDKGAWSGITVMAGAEADLAGTEVRFGEDGVRAFAGSAVTLVDGHVHHCLDRGAAFGLGVSATVEGTFFHDNAVGVQVFDATDVAMGRPLAAGGEGGDNTFSCQELWDVENLGPTRLHALRNHWGGGAPEPGAVQGDVDTGAFLLAPTAGATRGCVVRLRKSGPDVAVTWTEATSCATYLLRGATRPDGAYGLIGGPTADVMTEVAGEGLPGGTPSLFVRLSASLGATVGGELP